MEDEESYNGKSNIKSCSQPEDFSSGSILSSQIQVNSNQTRDSEAIKYIQNHSFSESREEESLNSRNEEK